MQKFSESAVAQLEGIFNTLSEKMFWIGQNISSFLNQ